MIPVLLSGGAGTRLWPVSRTQFPKQFCEFFENSLFESTLKRVLPFGSPWVVTVKDLKTLTDKAYRDLSLQSEQCLYEPSGKNTAPAVALLCKVLELKGLQGEIVGLFPADHLVEDQRAFLSAVRLAEKVAQNGFIVTLGIKPTYPSTGFGYIETEDSPLLVEDHLTAYRTKSFREKPQLKTAEEFLRSGRFSWNAGMFVFKVEKMIQSFKIFAPDVWDVINQLKIDLSNLESLYNQVPAISLDYAIMEREPLQACVPCQIGWSDLGSWDDISKNLPSTPVIHEKTSQNNFALTQNNKPVAFVGVEDLIVVESNDALLVVKKGRTQDVKDIVDQLKARSPQLAHQHTFEVRPWGRFEILRDELHFKSKLITVDPHQQLSYQSHTKRAELWIVVKGIGEVVLNDNVHTLKTGEFIHIPLGAKHRMRNPYSEPLEFVEVQTGSYFGEEDITRYQDDYSRI